MVPAHAGVVPCSSHSRTQRCCGPRARGGGPLTGDPELRFTPWSPRTRGWSPGLLDEPQVQAVVPAHAGVVPGGCRRRTGQRSGPRARGGGPNRWISSLVAGEWSPRTRGWSRRACVADAELRVVPAHAGVVPLDGDAGHPLRGGPRARGGGPCPGCCTSSHTGWSPRTRGWSRGRIAGPLTPVVVPAHAGVVPPRPDRGLGAHRGPRARGGGPNPRQVRSRTCGWSLRTRGWSRQPRLPRDRRQVVPAHAGVVPGHRTRCR